MFYAEPEYEVLVCMALDSSRDDVIGRSGIARCMRLRRGTRIDPVNMDPRLIYKDKDYCKDIHVLVGSITNWQSQARWKIKR